MAWCQSPAVVCFSLDHSLFTDAEMGWLSQKRVAGSHQPDSGSLCCSVILHGLDLRSRSLISHPRPVTIILTISVFIPLTTNIKMKIASLCTIALVALASCESRDVVTGHARVSMINTPAPVTQSTARPVTAKTVQPPAPTATPQTTAPKTKAVASQKQPELKPVQQPAPAAAPAVVRPAPRTRASQVQPKQRVLTPQSNTTVKKKRVLMPGQNRGLMAR